MKKVYFYSTCLGGAVFSDTCINAIKLLQREGVEVIFKKEQTCCGQISYNSGYFNETRKVALYNMELFSGEYPIVIPSGSCTGMMRVDYIKLFEGTKYEDKAKKFCSRIYELSEYLDKILKVKYEDKGKKIKVTWHSNCHALRIAKVVEHSKKILSSLKNVELIELEREDECCGFGGTFSIKEPGISDAMVSRKIEDIKNQKVKYVISGDGGCLTNISGALQKRGEDINCIHLYDFLADRIGIK